MADTLTAPINDVRDFLLAGGTFADLQSLAEAAPVWNSPPGAANGTVADDRPMVLIGTDEHRVIDQVVAALAADPDLYCRNGELVTVLDGDDPADNGGDRHVTARILRMPLPSIRERVTKFVHLCRETSEGPDSCHPTEWLVRGVASRGHWPGLRPLRGVVSTPVLRPDGSILSVDGYDRTTGLFLDAGGLRIDFPERPTLKDAQAGAAELLDVFRDFPLEQPFHASALLAAILTPLARPAFSGPAPLFGIDANVRGSGKSLLADVIGIVTTGGNLPRMSNPRENDEARKQITALAMRGEQVCLIDNVAGEFGGAAIDGALTSTEWQDRVLGRSEIVTFPLTVTWLCTGNNLQFAADTARRVCHIRMNCQDERPEERDGFAHSDLRKYVRENRGKLVRAALTILRAYCVAGRPQRQLGGWGSFEGWSGLIRQAIVWLGMPDPADGRAEMMERSDSGTSALRDFLRSFEQIDPYNEGLTTAEILQKLDRNRDGFLELREAILEMCGGSPERLPTVRTVANRLKHVRGRIVDGLMLDARLNRNKQSVWRVVSAGSAGSEGSVSYPNGILKLELPIPLDAQYQKGRETDPAEPADPAPLIPDLLEVAVVTPPGRVSPHPATSTASPAGRQAAAAQSLEHPVPPAEALPTAATDSGPDRGPSRTANGKHPPALARENMGRYPWLSQPGTIPQAGG